MDNDYTDGHSDLNLRIIAEDDNDGSSEEIAMPQAEEEKSVLAEDKSGSSAPSSGAEMLPPDDFAPNPTASGNKNANNDEPLMVLEEDEAESISLAEDDGEGVEASGDMNEAESPNDVIEIADIEIEEEYMPLNPDMTTGHSEKAPAGTFTVSGDEDPYTASEQGSPSPYDLNETSHSYKIFDEGTHAASNERQDGNADPSLEQDGDGPDQVDDEAQLPVHFGVEGEPSSITRRYTEIKNKAEQAADGESSEGRQNRFGDRLIEMGIITRDQLNVALQEKKVTGKMLGEVLVSLGFIDEETLSAVLAQAAGFEVFDPKHTIVDGDVLALIDKTVALRYSILPLSIDDDHIKVAMADPYDVLAMDTLRRYIPRNKQILPFVTPRSTLAEAIDAAYGYASSIEDIMQELEEGKEQKEVATLSESEAYAHPIVRLVNALLSDGVKMGVSDLHFEPEDNFVRLRYRLDGVLFTAHVLHKQHWSSISQRLKLMSEMNIADKMSPQDGRFDLNVGGKEVDFRVSSLPTVHGENIVLRVLDQSASIMPLSGLGFSPENMEKIKKSQAKPEGIIIVTGPTGSGKTTSLYSMLNEINDVKINIQTLEDPVEYALPMIRQTHVREGVLEFSEGIKALLRQDPDIIFIGEIRDGETANMALKAAMTGHQVYSTLHTNDSFGAIPRLFDLGLKPGMVAGALIAIFAQRLGRRLCKHCKEPYTATQEECELFKIDPENPPTIYKASEKGCEMCMGQGYKGRIALAEILTFDEELDEVLAMGKSKAEIKALAEKKGFKSMKDDGIKKILEGVTSVEAVARVVDIYK